MSANQQYKISEAIITSNRTKALEIDIKSQIAELNIYEHIEKPYLTGQLVVVDDNGIFAALKPMGNERFTFKVASVDAGVNVVFEHTFIMKNIESVTKGNDKTEVYVFNLIDEYAFNDLSLRFCKSYNGKLEDIATAIITSKLGIDVDRTLLNVASVQGPIKLIIPYMTPLVAAKWVLDRATTANGSPYYIHASMFDDNIRISELDTILTRSPFNSRLPYHYSTATTNDVVTKSEVERPFVIHNVGINSVDDTMKMIHDGALGALFTSQDVFENTKLQRHHAIRKTIERLQQNEVIPKETNQTVFDDKHKIRDEYYLDDVNSRYFHTLSSQGTYGNYRSYHDSYNGAEVLNRIQNISIRSMMERNRMDISFPGTGIFVRQVSVGDMIRINFSTPNVRIDGMDQNEIYDKQKSGDYMLYAVRHIFKGSEHNVTATVTKINTKK